MDTAQLVKAVFNRKFLKYFSITFGVFMLACLTGTYSYHIDLFIEKRVSFGGQVKFALMSIGSQLAYALSVAASIAAFLSFRNLPPQAGTSGFLKVLGIGTLLSLIVAAGIYIYDHSVKPVLNAEMTGTIYNLRQSGSPREIGEPGYDTAYFENLIPFTTRQKVLSHRIDSLSARCDTLRRVCGEILGGLPGELAREAYECYYLEMAGVPYKFSGAAEQEGPDGKYDVAVSSLYWEADQLHDTREELMKYRIENALRKMGAIGFIVGFLIFAAIGYSLRDQTIKLILGVIAAVILAVYTFTSISTQTKQLMERQVKAGREYMRPMRR